MNSRNLGAEQRANVEIVSSVYAAMLERGVEAAFEVADPAIIVEESPEWPDTRVFHGHAGLGQLFGLFGDFLDSFRMEPVDFIVGRGSVIAVVRIRGRAKGSGLDVDLPSFHVFTMHAGKAVRMQIFDELEPALAAAGLSEPRNG